MRACVRASGSCTEHARHTQLQAAAAAAAPDGGATQAAEDTCVCACLPPGAVVLGVAHSRHPLSSGKERDGPVLPVSRVKRICRLDGDVRQVSGDAVRLVAQATVRALRESGTLFLGAQQLSVVCFQKAHIYVRLIYVRNRSSS